VVIEGTVELDMNRESKSLGGEGGFIEDDVSRGQQVVSGEIEAPIPFILRVVAIGNTLTGEGSELVGSSAR
jgi:hypothetical protein